MNRKEDYKSMNSAEKVNREQPFILQHKIHRTQGQGNKWKYDFITHHPHSIAKLIAKELCGKWILTCVRKKARQLYDQHVCWWLSKRRVCLPSPPACQLLDQSKDTFVLLLIYFPKRPLLTTSRYKLLEMCMHNLLLFSLQNRH